VAVRLAAFDDGDAIHFTVMAEELLVLSVEYAQQRRSQ
jgi:hypothetical protein